MSHGYALRLAIDDEIHGCGGIDDVDGGEEVGSGVLLEDQGGATRHREADAGVSSAESGGRFQINRALSQVEDVVLLPIVAEDLQGSGASFGEIAAVGAAAVGLQA